MLTLLNDYRNQLVLVVQHPMLFLDVVVVVVGEGRKGDGLRLLQIKLAAMLFLSTKNRDYSVDRNSPKLNLFWIGYRYS